MVKENESKQKAMSNLESRYRTSLWRIYGDAAKEAAKLGIGIDEEALTEEMFSFDNFPATKKRINALLKSLHDDVQTEIVSGVEKAWKLANDEADELTNKILGDNVSKLTKEQKLRYFNNNAEALETFMARQVNGMNLSDRVWNYTNMFKENIEAVLDAGIREGMSAPEMATKLKQYLKYPDKLFRRVRGEDGKLHLSKAAKNFHPGRGVYRSSYMNALRLSATENNIAYRTSDYLRIQNMDFVVGIEVKLSNNHTLKNPQGGAPLPLYDICDELKGKYPKDFKFTGWHPFCRCHAETILKTREEMNEDMKRILDGKEPSVVSENMVKDVPDNFKEWMDRNGERIAGAKNPPYFIRDNTKYTGVKVMATLSDGSSGSGIPQKTAAEAAKERHANRTIDEKQTIIDRWIERCVIRDEDVIKNETIEYAYAYGKDGKKIVDKLGGQAHSVSLSSYSGKLEDAVVTHNHPSGRSFSEADINVAISENLKEIRAAGSKGRTFVMGRPDGGWNSNPSALWKDEYDRFNTEVEREFKARIASGKMTPAEAKANHYSEVWSRVAKVMGWKYKVLSNN